MLSFNTFIKDLRTIRTALLMATILFIAGGILGWLGTGSLQQLLNEQLKGISKISGNLRESSNPQWSFFVFIFLNNSIKSVVIIYLGALFGLCFYILPAHQRCGYRLSDSFVRDTGTGSVHADCKRTAAAWHH